MNISARSILMASVATVTASAVAIAPSVQPSPPPRPTIQLAASSQLLQQPFDPVTVVTDLAERILIPPSFGTPPPAPGSLPPVPTPGSVGSTIKDVYNSVEFWVDYGFEVGAWAFGWVPGIGWLAPQIWPIGYNLVERIVRSGVFNFADWIDGNGSFLQNLTEFGVDTINSFIQFGIDEWNFWLPSLPIPPLPGVASTTTTPLTTEATTVSGPGTLRNVALLAPDRLIASGPAQVAANAVETFTTTAREAVETTVSDVRQATRGPTRLVQSLVAVPGNVVNGAVQAQGEVRGAAAETTADDSQSTVRARGPVREAVTNTATTVTNRVTDTARDVASTVKKANDDTRTSVKKGKSDSE